ncbi:carbon-nitrogen hydrolase family protein [Sandarakinorhabdus rubra]|uniref:carbon-nitrogen hydrolase family protein n=1 Tax=Sandarakinorhabdus rubra TaxID=2672568 RepID=UPI0013DB159F|nr:carbon-nitrogen hydrolase family protein [Sandarakinorhabdus rubra]
MRLALVQTNTGIDPRMEAVHLPAQIAKAAADGAQIVFTPEMSGLLDRDRARAASHIAHEADDVVLSAVREAAARHGVWVQLGSLALKGAGEKFVNRGFLIAPDGNITARYAKIHLFDVALGSESWRESAAYDAGDTAVLAQTPWGGLGLTICYDLRFPALHRALAEAGAAMLAVPAAFTRPTGAAHWHVLLRARAIETGCWVIAAAQSGIHQDGRATYGHSLVVSPWGEVTLDMGEAPGIGLVDIDLGQVAAARAKVPALDHARPFRLERA